MTRIEIIVDALARMHAFHSPLSRAYQLRNPIMLRAFAPKHIRTEDGYRIFSNFPSGYDNAIQDVRIKCAGGSRTKLQPTNTLDDLIRCYGNPTTATNYIVKFMRHVAITEQVRTDTPLSWFLETHAKTIHTETD